MANIEENTEKFQTLFMKILDEYVMKIILNEENKEEKDQQEQNEFIEELKRLVEKGANINKEFYVEFDYTMMSPLDFLISRYYYAGIKYMDSQANFFDEVLSFLFSKDVMIDKKSIQSSFRDLKMFEELLKRANDEDIVFELSTNPSYLEIITGFPIRLDNCISYEFSYVNKEEQSIYYKKYQYLPIECVLLDYATERGSAITTDEKRKEVISILKKQGSPFPNMDKINLMLKKMIDANALYSTKEKSEERLKESYDYFVSV